VPTPEEKAEKEARKACKIKLCAIIASKDPAGEDVACDIVKTWREADIAKMLGQDRLAVGQGGLPVETRAEAKAAGSSHGEAPTR